MNKAQEIIALRCPNWLKEQYASGNASRVETDSSKGVSYFGMMDGSSIEVKRGRLRALSPIMQPVIRKPSLLRATRFIIADNPLASELSDEFLEFTYEAQRDFNRRYMEPTRDVGVSHRLFCAA